MNETTAGSAMSALPERMAAQRVSDAVSGRSRIWRALNSAANVLLLAWVLAALAVVAFSMGPRLAGYQALIVRSGSMEPAIATGSVVVVRPVPPDQLAVGDVITFERADGAVTVVTHRIVEVVEAGSNPVFRTQGDANTTPDPFTVQYRDVGWRVAIAVPHVGYFFNALAHPAPRVALVGLPALLLCASFIRDIWRWR